MLLFYFSFKINELIHLLNQSFIFLIELLLKIQVSELNNRFVFHQTGTVDVQLILES